MREARSKPWWPAPMCPSAKRGIFLAGAYSPELPLAGALLLPYPPLSEGLRADR